MRNDGRALILALLVGLVVGCGKKAVPAAAPEALAPTATTGDASREAAERAAREAEAAAAAQRETTRAREILETRVFFDYDEAEIRSDARQVLSDKVGILRDMPAVRLRVEGHADERGSTEYNQALASRRASSVVTYLAGFGISAERFETVSLGEERPLAQGHDERAWSQNRRGEFVITAGAPAATDAARR
jgi:peptidoglycan-associated lipoprotein